MRIFFTSRHLVTSLTVATCLTLSQGCKDPLQEQVYSFISTENFYRTASDADGAVVAAYQPFLTADYFANRWFSLGSLLDDQVTIGRNPVFQAVDNFNITADHPFVMNVWQQMYQGINRANTGIQRIPGINMDATRRAALVGECQFIRAYNYFNLVRLFGGVPLTTAEIETVGQTNTPKATKEKVYEQIIADLKEAEKTLPATRAGSEVGRVTKGAAQTMLAEVYLTMERWQEAADKAQEVIKTGQYRLLDDFARVFAADNENNAEIIFSIQFAGPVIGNSMASFAHAFGTDNPNCANGVQVWSVDEKSDMWRNWDDKDARKGVSVYDKITNKAGRVVSVYTTSRPFPAFGKYNAPNEISQDNSPLNPTVYRYSDVLLMYAEAASQAAGSPPAEAYAALNQVRRRGYKVPQTVPAPTVDLSGLSKEAFRQAVIRERSLEFVLEIRRIFDLLRTSQLVPTLTAIGKTVRPGVTLLPIPLSELNSNAALSPSDQNPGY